MRQKILETFEIKDCDKTAKHGQYDQAALHDRLMQSVVGEIDAIARFPEGKAALQSKFKGVKMRCVAEDTCSGDSKADKMKCDGPAYVYDSGYYYVHYQVGDSGEAMQRQHAGGVDLLIGFLLAGPVIGAVEKRVALLGPDQDGGFLPLPGELVAVA